jgi:hypothetical protein
MHISWLVVRHGPFRDTCLRRALVIGSRLSALEPRLVIGVRPGKTVREVDAHAWLRIGSRDIDPLASSYLAMVSQ